MIVKLRIDSKYIRGKAYADLVNALDPTAKPNEYKPGYVLQMFMDRLGEFDHKYLLNFLVGKSG